jgi:hypothetical protein
MLNHPWLKENSNYETKMTTEELAEKQVRDEIKFDEEEIRVETSKLIDSDLEQHRADDELSTFSDSLLGSDSDDSFTIKKTKKVSLHE